MTALTTRLRRGLLFPAAFTLLATAAAGCVTVHGEQALLPAVKQAEAVSVLNHFTAVNNDANSKLDPTLNGQIETGALGAIDQAGIKAQHINNPSGNPGYTPLQLSDARFLIPQQRGWPKWFVADTASNRDKNRWLLVFIRDSAHESWRASYLSVLSPAQLPDFAADSAGYAEPVPATGSDLLVQPGELGAEYAAYLQQGDKGSAVFAKGGDTSGVRDQRRTQYPTTSQVVTQFQDDAADPGQYTPVALRLRDGGALVFFTTHHSMKQTVTKPPLKIRNPDINALMTGTPNTSVTLNNLAEQAVKVPAGAQADGKVTFLNRIQGLISAQGS